MQAKKLFSILLISLLLLNFGGLFLYFPLQLFRIHREMRLALKGMPDDQLDVFKLSKADFIRAIVDDDEVELNGRMFDIARTRVQKDSVIVFALHDKAEDSLLAFLDEIVKRPLQDKKMPPIQIYQFITLSFLPPDQEHFNSVFKATGQTPNTLYLFSSCLFIRTLESPPPRV